LETLRIGMAGIAFEDGNNVLLDTLDVRQIFGGKGRHQE